MTTDDDIAVLSRGLDQLAELLDGVRSETRGDRTPCADWTVQDLVDHVVASPGRFARMIRGESIDWAAPTPAAGADPAGAFRTGADELLREWRDREGASAGSPLDWQCAEFAVHTWDLATALGRSTADLDANVAERGFAFMHANLTADNRAAAFGAERPAPEDADAYQRIAAFAGRDVT